MKFLLSVLEVIKECLKNALVYIDNTTSRLYYVSMNGKEIIKALEKEGWELKTVKGSHHMMVRDSKKVPVPVHGTKDVPKPLIRAIEKQTGVKLL